MSESCIVRRFRHSADLRAHDIGLLETLEGSARIYAKHSIVRAQQQPVTCIYTLHSGWAFGYRILANGDRQVLDIFLPGDVMGLRDLACKRSNIGFATLTEAEVCAVPRRRLGELFQESTHLTNLFFMIAAREQAMLLERVVNLGRRSAIQKVSHLLMEICVRLERVDPHLEVDCELPLSQALLADALGLSEIHVNRTLRRLRENGLVETCGGAIRLLDRERLEALAEFDAVYLEEDASWL
ncbi:MAG: Crp/Fnr family transcriptional regulator [Gammaproteobacteria bacterium]